MREGQHNGRDYWRRLHGQKEQILNVRAEAMRRQSPLERAITAPAR